MEQWKDEQLPILRGHGCDVSMRKAEPVNLIDRGVAASLVWQTLDILARKGSRIFKLMIQ